MHFEGFFFFFKKSFPFSCFSPTCCENYYNTHNYGVDDYDMIMMSLSKGRCDRDLVLGCTSSGKTPQECEDKAS